MTERTATQDTGGYASAPSQGLPWPPWPAVQP